ncbi:DUF4011 domain-containing protein [Lichenibacterium ramalinae]|uniref:DUF4011 domain-containing protein n=1 Tax=Lichenibacterium ramalinae TaxID=2316527 RepID=A0A4Q2RCX1_9HYPH|nr:DUF4011 domain-containing protein [Lichenibacterium ramalinae]
MLVRVCPSCGDERPVDEFVCGNELGGVPCHWPLADEEITEAGASAAPAVEAALAPAGPTRACVNGHPLEAGDEMCLECGADPAPGVAAEPDAGQAREPGHPRTEDVRAEPDVGADVPPSPTVVGGWEVRSRVTDRSGVAAWERFEVVRPSDGREAWLTLYRVGREPDAAVHEALGRIPREHVPELLATGRHEGRAYEISELVEGGSLADLGGSALEGGTLRRVVAEMAEALDALAEIGLRHRDLRPTNVLVRTREPLDLVVTGFGSARLSDFDLEAVAPLELTRYSAPEAIVGAVSASSDWWSLGMMALELATGGECFRGVDDQALRLHVVTTGMPLPRDLADDVRMLLRGLLARDPSRRWAGPEVRAWLAGAAVAAPDEVGVDEERSGPSLELAGRRHFRPEAYALAAAHADAWEEARGLTLGGALATWLAQRDSDPRIVAQVRVAASDGNMTDDLRHAVALMAVNPNLPLTVSGRIVTPAWLLERPDEGYALVTGQVVTHLELMGREPWLTRMRARVDAVRERARLLEVELDEGNVRVALLSSSRANLEAERDALRRVYPDSDHSGLASLVGRAKLTEEDLILLVGAAPHQFVPLATLADSAREMASRAGLVLDDASLAGLLTRPRREVLAAVDERTSNFARCGNPRVDEWADAFRTERRLALPRAAALLAVPAEAWREPPKQQYVADLLGAFEKRLAGAVGRGPLARFTLGKTTPRLDLAELGTALRPAEGLLAHVLGRVEAPVAMDPGAFLDGEGREGRLRRLVGHAETFRRDTGIDGRYLGFPFLASRDARSSSRPRLMPVLLWPVAIELASGAGQRATLAFDRGRDEVRLNPALEGLLGGDAFVRWLATRDEVLGRTSVRPADVVDAFGALAAPRGRKLVPLPSKDASVPPGSLSIVPSAALFNAEFVGQAVAEDLRQMRQRSLAGTALEVAIRVAPATDGDAGRAPPERDRFLTVASDPSQDAAVLRSREAPGLLVEGPPGTGKSQTIVNMLADAIGRGETVLVVCQKLAALQVVQKRMAAEGMGDRLFVVTDVNRDREPIIRSLRDQLAETRTSTPARGAAIRRARDEKAAQIEVVEGELDRRHEALHASDDFTGMSYRDALGELIAVEAEGPYVDAAGLRRHLARLDRGGLARLEQTCAPLARTWLDSRYEGSPLGVLRTFPVDASVEADVEAGLRALSAEEGRRSEVLARCATAFEMADPIPFRAWLDHAAGLLGSLADDVRQRLGAWVDLFRPEAGRATAGSDLIASLRSLELAVHALDASGHDDALFQACSTLSAGDLGRLAGDVKAASAPASFWGRLSPSRRARVRRVDAFLAAAGQPVGPPGHAALAAMLSLEAASRPHRAALGDVQAALGYSAEARPLSIPRLRELVGSLIDVLEEVEAPATTVHACPPGFDAAGIAREASRDAVGRMRRAFEDSFARREAEDRSEGALARLSDWFEGGWTAVVRSRIAGGAGTADLVDPVLRSLDSLPAFQRLRARALDAQALTAFAVLRGAEPALRSVAPDLLEPVVRRTIRREGLLSWKARLEGAHPELTFERGEVERKVAVLAALSDEMRELNRQSLAAGIDPTRLAKASAWEDVTRLRGPRTRRLREIMEVGPDLGLMHLRPVWLMSPDVASRLLPLKAAAFDLVVYDEASQMPVEHAVPTLYRGRRVVVSGDEKQMPPSNFFGGRVDEDDEARDDEEPDDEATETERAAHEEAWNRRDVQGCPDLLQLARTCLPATTLQIHYRSKYRELIAFSNGAFYSGKLSVPVRHPDDEVRRARPVEVLRVDGTYERQTNEAEAARVVDVLAAIWSVHPAERPSVGVVTFNRKQADLVDDMVEARAAADPAFLEALERERNRTQGGEDMGFFVKNVENVQGDERDVIVFSTTFGRDRKGAFKKSFGVLGHTGGERRLNVAVTRARDRVVLVTSMPVRDVSDWLAGGRAPDKPRDYLQAYLDHAERLSRGDLDGARAMRGRLGVSAARRPGRDDPSDGFVRSVEAFLVGLGHKPVRNADGEDAFALDFAIEDPRTGLFGIGIECDAPRHPLLAQARAREVWRPKVLGRAVPRVHRIASTDWYEDGAAERARLAEAVGRAMELERAS